MIVQVLVRTTWFALLKGNALALAAGLVKIVVGEEHAYNQTLDYPANLTISVAPLLAEQKD